MSTAASTCQRGHAKPAPGKCLVCKNKRNSRFRARRRIMPQIEPEVDLIQYTDVPRKSVHVARGFWMSVAERVKLLEPSQALRISFRPDEIMQPNTAMLAEAGKKAGVRIGRWWGFGALYVWRIGRAK